MKTRVGFFGLVVVTVLAGCAAPRPYYYGEQYPIEPAAPVQYAPPQPQVAPVVHAPVYVGCQPPYVPVWNGCALPSPPVVMYVPPMYGGGYYSGYGDPLFRFNFNFGKGGRHHRRW